MASPDLPPLHTSGRFIAGPDGTPVVLRGVNRSGLEYAEPWGARGFLEAAGLCVGDVRAMTGWGANVIRVPFNQDFVLRGRGDRSAGDYLRALDQVVEWGREHGAYTLLDLQWIDADTPRGRNSDGSLNFVPPLPDAASIEVWSTLAARYRHSPAVLFDVFNEPHDPLFDDLVPLVGPARPRDPSSRYGTGCGLERLPSRKVGMDEWQPWARCLIDAVRREHPTALVFVSGVAWAFDLRGFPLREADGRPMANVVYSTHVYPWSRTGLVRLRPLEAEWTAAFGDLSQEFPVFAGEWGGVGQLEWGRRLERYLRERGIGWAAWGWADWPHLVGDCRAGDYTATPFGELVRTSLQR